MTMSKEFQRLEKSYQETLNKLDIMGAQLNALVAKALSQEERDAIIYPPARLLNEISSAPPYRIKEVSPEDSTLQLPETEASDDFVPSTEEPVLIFKDTLVPPVSIAAPTTEPSEGYDKLTEGEAIKLVKGIVDPVEQETYLAYERANKNRPRVLEAIIVVPVPVQTTVKPV